MPSFRTDDRSHEALVQQEIERIRIREEAERRLRIERDCEEARRDAEQWRREQAARSAEQQPVSGAERARQTMIARQSGRAVRQDGPAPPVITSAAEAREQMVRQQVRR